MKDNFRWITRPKLLNIHVVVLMIYFKKKPHTLEINGKRFTNICAKACKGYNFKLIEIINGLNLVI